MTTHASKPITELDFFKNREALKDYLKGQNRFKDYDFEGSNMAVLLDVLSYNTHLNAFYLNMVFSEMFLDSAQLDESILSHAKHLNYLPRSYRSAQAKVDLTFTVNNNPSFITIPKYTKFTAKKGNRTFTFTTDENHTVSPSGNVYSISNVAIYEGRILTENFEVKEHNEEFVLSNEKVDTSSIEVKVRETTDASSANSEYTVRQNLFGVDESDNVFYIEPEDKNKYKITFGRDVFGKQPEIGNVVEVTYRISTGEDANRMSVFTSGQISGYDVSVTTSSNSSSGASKETNDSIKFYAPKSIQIQDRAVTESDYEILLKRAYTEIEAVTVFGGEEIDPPQYGRVFVAIKTKDSNKLSQNLKNKFTKFLSTRSPIAITPVVESPDYIYLDVNTTVYYNLNKTTASEGEIKTKVLTAITDYDASALNDFDKTLRYSKFINEIDQAHNSIISNDTTVRAIVEFIPEISSSERISVSFLNKLRKDQPILTSQNIENTTPAVISSNFTYNGTTSYFQDDGKGVIHILKRSGDSFSYVKRNVGTVNYDTGDVIISYSSITSYEGNAIKLYGRTKNKDIKATNKKYIEIRDEDVKITVEGVRVK